MHEFLFRVHLIDRLIKVVKVCVFTHCSLYREFHSSEILTGDFVPVVRRIFHLADAPT